ncbi:acyl-CoA dehydrogenase family protein [Mycobacterium sp. URHB0044]|jgi:alkylation response protein AidB-like acyl-CoA dehydrogenase|uniref:acyl-CoA dehydrogenase family protein n=1 Tax=Mycobacterium sp. URHB0044 TaxID=1380386 RepID=UPI0009E0B5BD|nr:acyl-CoA dehydrogenase family protein [Mycobacterium sp. URHB0044]
MYSSVSDVEEVEDDTGAAPWSADVTAVADTDQILDDFEAALRDSADELAPLRVPATDMAGQLGHSRRMMNWLHDGGWLRWGWPEAVGGFGGSALIRAQLLERLALAGYDIPEHLLVLEVVGPAVVKHAPQLAAERLPAALRGNELWSQGFSEPEAGSDLAALRTKAVEQDDGTYLINGQKIWTSYGAFADRIVLLARSGAVSDRHRGLVMLLVDLDAAGVERRPIALASGREELAEVFFTDVVVDAERVIGTDGGGWAVAMDLLQYERGTYAWMRMATATAYLQQLLRALNCTPTALDSRSAAIVGRAYLNLAALRARTADTLGKLASNVTVGSETSVDKLLLSTAEQDVLDAAMSLLGSDVLISDDESAAAWRDRWWYSRAASIYGGAREVQYSIVADRILHLPRENASRTPHGQ